MSETGVARAYRLLAAGLDALEQATGPTATDDELMSVLTVSEGFTRRSDRLVVGVVADLDRRGTFTDRGYRNTTTALADLLRWDRGDARRRVIAAEQAHPRTGLDGTPLPAHLPHTAEAFATGGTSLRHVDIVARHPDRPPSHTSSVGRCRGRARRQGTSRPRRSGCRTRPTSWPMSSTPPAAA